MSRPHIVILGAGISGLATAWFLRQELGSQVQLTILEKSPRPGGWMQTVQTGDYLFEQGPRSCRPKGNGQATLALVEALGLQDQVITPSQESQSRYIYDQGRLQRLPRHLWEVPFSPLMSDWFKALWRDWTQPKRQVEDESIHAFFSRRLGPSWVERLIDPFVLGIYAGDCTRLSLKSCFPLFDQWEHKQGSLLKGAWCHPASSASSAFFQRFKRIPLFSFKEGMETLPRALANQLQDCLMFQQAAHELNFVSAGVQIQLETGQSLKADHVISTLPTWALADLLKPYPQLVTKLNALQYANVTVVHVGCAQQVLPFKGFGYLVPSKHQSPILGCVWDSCVFPQQNLHPEQTRLTLMMGGVQHPEVEHWSLQEIEEKALETLADHCKIKAQPQCIEVKRAKKAIPQYEVGYDQWKGDLMQTVQTLTTRLTLSGNAFTGVAVNDCIAQAEQLAQQLKIEI